MKFNLKKWLLNLLSAGFHEDQSEDPGVQAFGSGLPGFQLPSPTQRSDMSAIKVFTRATLVFRIRKLLVHYEVAR